MSDPKDDDMTPVPLVPVTTLPVSISPDKNEDASGDHILEELARDAQPVRRRCPHCGGSLADED